MSHNLDTTAGQTSFVSAREDAWHQLGTVLPDCFTAEEAMTHGHLGGWNLRKEEIFAHVGGQQVRVSGRHAVVRDNPINGNPEVLGDVGDAYKIVHNEQLAGLLNHLVDESGAHFETAGAIDGGRKVFITMKLPGHMMVGGADRIDNYIAAMTSHDGNSSTQLVVTPVRVVCQNTLNVAFGRQGHSNSFKVRHTVGAERILINEAREALDLSFNYLDDFQQAADRMINTQLTLSQFEQIVADQFSTPDDAPAATRTRNENKADEIVQLFADAHTHEGVRDTVWAGFNAFTEWADHYAPVRGAGAAVGEAELRSRKALLDPGFKTEAYKLMSALV